MAVRPQSADCKPGTDLTEFDFLSGTASKKIRWRCYEVETPMNKEERELKEAGLLFLARNDPDTTRSWAKAYYSVDSQATLCDEEFMPSDKIEYARPHTVSEFRRNKGVEHEIRMMRLR